MPITAQHFITKWGPGGPAFELNERQGAQPHFLDLCDLLDVPKPGSAASYRFEEKNHVIGAKIGYADVFMPGVFAWENKAPGKNLDAALKQLLTYSLALSNPPILVVCDRQTIRIHTQFNGHPSETHTVLLNQLDQPDKLALLRRIWLDPESFRPKITSRDITNAAANSFATLAEGLRRRNAKPDDSAETQEARANQVAHFLTQCLFCFFAEDVGLLPNLVFQRLITAKLDLPTRDGLLPSEKLARGLSTLFSAMRTGDLFGVYDIPRFNGNLFKTIDVPVLSIMDVTELRNAANLNWAAIDVSIFGTLFERGLDPAKRSQLGAHYTDPATIMRIVQPVIERPLLQLWELVAQDLKAQMAKSRKKGDASYRAARERFVKWLDELATYRILDPACGSGNFLFLGLKTLKDIEHKSHLDAAALGLDREADLVTGPHNVLGIELNEYAAELACVTVWIGELQWRMAHGYEFKTNPVLEPLDHIECRDALLSWSGSESVRPEPVERLARNAEVRSPARDQAAAMGVGSEFRTTTPAKDDKASRNSALTPIAAGSTPTMPSNSVAPKTRYATEAPWPKASVVIGNPPFLGDRKMIRELGEGYTFALRSVYEDRVPGSADLVCYWFEKARTAIETNGLGAAGLVATNSIRGGANRRVLDAIAETSRIYEAWSDEGWVNDGAAVRVSLVCFGHADQTAVLNGSKVQTISSDLSPTIGVANVGKLAVNANTSYIGTQKNGPFDVPREIAIQWLRLPNPNGKSNASVVRPWANGLDVTRRPQDRWVVDFGCDMAINEAALFEAPFAQVERVVKPTRTNVRRDWHRKHWWLYGDARPGLREKLSHVARFIVTPMVAKHRVFAWMPSIQIPENLCVAITRADDTTFGILHSRFHELWSLRMGTSLEDRPRYTPTTCFETFPFPAGLTPADTAHQRTETLEGGAVIPADISEQQIPFSNVLIEYCATDIIANRISTSSRPQAHDSTRPTRTDDASTPQQAMSFRAAAIAIATAAKHLTDLRDNWLNPKEWTHKVKEITPLGMGHSPYPDRIEPKPGISEEDLKSLQKRTLTNLYNLRPSWLAIAHAQLDAAVAAAYGWADYTTAMPDDEILKRLLALNLERSNSARTEDTNK